MNPTLTLVIPTYNEADIIESSLRKIGGDMGDLAGRTEVIIADDGTDEMPEVINRLGNAGFQSVHVMRNKEKRGKGQSIANAFIMAKGGIAGFIDVDLSVDPIFIRDAVSVIQDGSDICIASRLGNRFKSDKSLATSVLATLFSWVHRTLIFGWGNGFADTQCGFKFFKTCVATELFQNLVAPDGLTDLEVLVKAVRRGYKVSEIKVPRRNDREGKRKLSRIVIPETFSLMRIFFKYRLGMGKN